MYNMDITIPVINYKVNLEILILIGVVYLIMAVHTVCSCCNVKAIVEGLTNMTKEGLGTKKKDEEKVEGFVGANTNYGQSTPYDIASSQPVDTSAWMKPNLTVVPGQPLDPAVQAILDRPKQPVPLPEGEMLMFANTPFKPECCGSGGSTYSTSTGCACMTVDQYNYLVQRGSNNVPFSEY
jgi:hypothetical protein